MKADHTPIPDELRRGLAGPMRWRLLLAVIFVSGLALLHRIDKLLQRENAREANAQAVQADALMEGFIRQRVQFLNTLGALIGSARTDREERERFAVLATEMRRELPDIAAVYLLDVRGTVLESEGETILPGRPAPHRSFPLRAPAMEQAAEARAVAATAPLKLADGRRGTLLYLPIVARDRITGYVAAAFAYERLFDEALTSQLGGRYPYRVLDESGEVIVASADFPAGGTKSLTQVVSLPGGHYWRLEVAIESLLPSTSRRVNWITGALVLLLVTFLALREEMRARRFAAYSRDLELLSRDLLDANMRLEDRAQQIAEANRAKSRFLANVSHELRTPLNAIVGYNALALDGMYGDMAQPLRSSHERIQAAADHLLGLVNDVLDLSKIEVGRMEIDVQPVDLTSVLDSVATVVEPAAGAKGLRIDVIVGRNLPRLQTDPRHLRQILLNLAANAIKFTERGAVTLTARALDDGQGVEIVVEDTGIGIAAHDLERIFEEFEQVRPGGRGDSMQRGSGLGLAIARKLARLLGGDVHVSSRVGVGSRFTLRLPPAAPEPPPRATPTSVPVITDEALVRSGVAAGASASATAHATEGTPRPERDSGETARVDGDSGEHGALSVAPSRGVDSPRMED